jgi:hypothetical protein
MKYLFWVTFSTQTLPTKQRFPPKRYPQSNVFTKTLPTKQRFYQNVTQLVVGCSAGIDTADLLLFILACYCYSYIILYYRKLLLEREREKERETET